MMERGLSRAEREQVLQALVDGHVAPPEVCQRAVERCTLLRRTPTLTEVRGPGSGVAYAALKTRASAITLGERVFIRREFFADDGHVPLDLIAHEVTHVAQFLRDGFFPFLWLYLRDYLGGRTRGMDDHTAYLAIPYEVEARRVADLLSPSN